VIDIDANFDLTEVDRAMADVEARARRLAPAFRELRRPLRTDQRAHARAAEGPDGRWPPRSPFTEARRQVRNRAVRVHRFDVLRRGEGRRRSTPKQILGRLPAAILVKVGELYIRATSRAAWAGIHQYGGNAGRGRRVRIPARPFLWLSDGLLRTARDVLGNYVVKGWTR
jgi:phage gpG-like protein